MIRYACVAAGASILAEHEHHHSSPLSSLATQCLQAAPEFHAVYTHTARKQMYAFLTQKNQIEEAQQNQGPPHVFFAIADESLGRAEALLFLHHLRESFESKQRHKDHLDLPQLVLFFNSNGETHSPRDLDSGGGEERRQDARKVKKGKKREGSSDDGQEMEIAVVDCERDRRHLAPAAVGKKSVEKIWRQHVRIVILLDVVICSIIRGAVGYGLSADIRIRIRLQFGYGYHFFTSVNIRIRIRIRRLGEDTDMVKTIFDPYPIRYPKVECLIMISAWKRLFFNGLRQ